MADYGVRAHLVVRDPDRITCLSGRDCCILDNCFALIALAPDTTVEPENHPPP